MLVAEGSGGDLRFEQARQEHSRHRANGEGAAQHGAAARPEGERRYFTPSRSTSKISVAPGGMSAPAPLAP